MTVPENAAPSTGVIVLVVATGGRSGTSGSASAAGVLKPPSVKLELEIWLSVEPSGNGTSTSGPASMFVPGQTVTVPRKSRFAVAFGVFSVNDKTLNSPAPVVVFFVWFVIVLLPIENVG